MIQLTFYSYATPPMLLALNLRAGFVYGAFSVPVTVLFWLLVPETKG
jgi:MFS transporter, SP family, general alpha glucoside:H+ symporter